MVLKVLARVAAVLVAIFAIGWVAVYWTFGSDPMEDMRLRADSLPIPGDFVLVCESYSGTGFNDPAKLERVYHASWPGLCDSLRSIRDWAGDPYEMVQAPGYEGRMCHLGSMYPAGWRGWCKNFRHYNLRLFAWDAELVQGMPPDWPSGMFVLYPLRDDGGRDTIRIPAGRAKILVEVLAERGR